MTIFRGDMPVARKTHKCAICGCDITPGTRYFHQVNDFDGFCDFKAHQECFRYELDRRDHNEDDSCPEQTSCWLNDDLEDLLGSKDAVRKFRETHNMFECVKFVLGKEEDEK